MQQVEKRATKLFCPYFC